MKSADSRSLTAAAVGAVCGAAVALAASTWFRRRPNDDDSSRNIDNPVFRHDSRQQEQQQQQQQLPPELRQEQISRHTLYFGPDGMKALQRARICLVGVGGVGSHAAMALARSGLGYLRLVDFDVVSLSSLNRHACAGLADVGRPKVHVVANDMRRICPDDRYLRVDAMNEMYTVQRGASQILDTMPRGFAPDNDEDNDDDPPPWTMVLDAIDDVPTKAQLIADCASRGIRVVSCMGAGGKADLTRLHVSDLRAAARDPLATKLRQCLKRLLSADAFEALLDDMTKLTIVFSSEKTVVGLADFSDEQKEQGVQNFGAVDGMRIRIVPVLATMPAIMGQGMAAVALTEIGRQPLQPVTAERVGRGVRHKLLQKLRTRESRFAKVHGADLANVDPAADPAGRLQVLEDGRRIWVGPAHIDDSDVEYLLEVWRNRCAITQKRTGAILELIRWDPEKPGTCDNLILLSSKAMQQFEKTGRDGVDPTIRQQIEARLAICRVDAHTLQKFSPQSTTMAPATRLSTKKAKAKDTPQDTQPQKENPTDQDAGDVPVTQQTNSVSLESAAGQKDAFSSTGTATPDEAPQNGASNVIPNKKEGESSSNKGKTREIVRRRRRRKTAEEKTPLVDPVLLDKVLRESSLPSAYSFEVLKTVERILELQAGHVALQMPEGLLMYATVLADIFRRLAPCCKQVSVLGDVTYGACCIDDLGAEALGANLLVHYGHSCLVPLQHTTIPCLYVFVEIQLDVPHLVDCVDITVAETTTSPAKPFVYLLGTVQFRHALVSAKRLLQERGFEHVVIPQAKPLSPGEVLGCTSPSLVQHQEVKVERAIVCFLADGRFHLESTLISNAKNGIQAFYRYDPYSKTLTEEAYDHSAMYGLRKSAIQSAASARSFGILMGTLGRQGNPAIVQRIRQTLKKHCKKHFLMLVSEITPAKLKLFGDKVDAWIQVACPRLSVDWGHHLANKPVLSPYELFVCLEEASWQNEYPMDFYSQSGGPWSNYYEENRGRQYKQVQDA